MTKNNDLIPYLSIISARLNGIQAMLSGRNGTGIGVTDDIKEQVKDKYLELVGNEIGKVRVSINRIVDDLIIGNY